MKSLKSQGWYSRTLPHNWFEYSGLKETSDFNSEPLRTAICIVPVWTLSIGGKVESVFPYQLITLFFVWFPTRWSSSKHWQQRSELVVTTCVNSCKSQNSHRTHTLAYKERIFLFFNFFLFGFFLFVFVKQSEDIYSYFSSPSFWQMKQETSSISKCWTVQGYASLSLLLLLSQFFMSILDFGRQLLFGRLTKQLNGIWYLNPHWNSKALGQALKNLWRGCLTKICRQILSLHMYT